MGLLVVVVVMTENVLAVLALRPEVSSGDERRGMEGTSCAEAKAKGRDEVDSCIILTARSSDANVCALLLLPVLL